MHDEEWIPGILAERKAQHALRTLDVCPGLGGRYRNASGREIVSFRSNDYLDLARHPHVVASARAALEEYGAGAGAARLIGGTLPVHDELESRLAASKGYEACLLFGSGYLANLGILGALCGRQDRIYADKLAHACLIDGTKLSGGELIRFRHNDSHHLDELLQRDADKPGRKIIVTESIFSMDGDVAPLRDLTQLATQHPALLLVDEAHATGTHGPAGAGLVAELGLQAKVNLCMGTLSKALGSYGGFVCCSHSMKELLVNQARTFLFATALPPAAIGAALGALDVLRDEPERAKRLHHLADELRAKLVGAGWDVLGSTTQIIPVLVKDNARAMALADRLRSEGMEVAAIRPPTVPEGTARLRLSVSAAHRPEDIRRLLDILGTNS